MESGSIHLWWWQHDIADRGKLKCHLLSHSLRSWREDEVNLKERNTFQFYYRNLSAPAAVQLIRLVHFSHRVNGVNVFPSHTKASFLYLLPL